MSAAEFTHAGARIALDAIALNLTALREARSKGSERDPDRAQVLMPWVGQALFWIVALDDLLNEAHKSRSYRERRDADIDGRYLEGARLARNAVAHGAVVVHSFQEGMTFPMTFPLTFGEVRWSSLEDVLRQWPGGKAPSESQRSSYQRNFVNIQPQEPLGAAWRWLGSAPSNGWAL